MAGKFSIHDTHRLPYSNAKITAKQLSDSTTPVKFRTFQGVEIGLEVRTNARGYCCQSDGTPYNDGVFVAEDAIVTATMPDGSSTSWTVGGESDITIFDGKLYGREITDPSEYSDDDVIIGNTHYKRIFSANQQSDSPLSLLDLLNVPNFVKWTEDQQIERFDAALTSGKYNVYLKNQTKTLILFNSNPNANVQTYPKSFDVYIHATLDDAGKTRFGRNFTVTNLTGMRINLVNAEFGQKVIGGVETGYSVEVAETYPNAQQGSDIGGEALFMLVDNAELASNGGVVYSIPNNGASNNGVDFIEITDATPPILNISGITSQPDATFKPVMVKYTGSRQTFRRVVLRRFDTYTRPLALCNSFGQFFAMLTPLGDVEITVTKDANDNTHEGIVNNITPFYRAESIKLKMNDKCFISAGASVVNIDASSASTSYTAFKSSIVVSTLVKETYRLEFLGNTVPCWVKFVNDDGLETASLCDPADGGRVVIDNTCGVVHILSRSWKPWKKLEWNGSSTWTAEALTYDIDLDIGVVNSLAGGVYGYSHSGPTNDLDIRIPIADGQSVLARFNVHQYSAADDYESKNPHINIYGTDGQKLISDIENGTIFNGWYDFQDEQNNILLSSQLVTCKITRSGNTASVSELVRHQKDFE